MKYSGVINILDDDGNIVFEKELSEDEIVESLLAGIPESDEEVEPADEVAPPPKSKSLTFSHTITKAAGCSECASTTRHKNSCSKAKDSAGREPATKNEVTPASKRDPADVLTRDQWEQVREMRDIDDKSSLFIANEIGLSLQQVNYALLSPKYDIYLRNANRTE